MEYGIALLLFHFSRLGTPGLDPKAMSRILDNQHKKTAGQLIVILKGHLTVSPGIEPALAEGLHARNLIIHRVLADKVDMFHDADKRAQLKKNIRRLRRKVRDADSSLSPFITALSAKLDSFDQEAFEKETKALFT